ncbi:MAG: DUF4395 domain-containing protein [Breznakibacter sp.]
MKSIVCPISSERVPSALPRITAFYVVAVLLAAIITGSYLLIVLLSVDFYLRGFNLENYSPLTFLSKKTSGLLDATGRPIDKAPKLFAARLGFVFTLAIVSAGFSGLSNFALILSIGLMGFALLEGVFGLCVGCVIYSWLVLPFVKAN